MNLTEEKFDKNEFKLLNKNMNFVPNPGKYNKKIFEDDMEKYFRRLALRAYFKSDQKFKYEGITSNSNSTWMPKTIHHSVKTYIQAVKNDIEDHVPTANRNNRSNLSQGEQTALANLKKRDDILISKADKGGAVVIQDVGAYITEAERQLNDTTYYERQDEDLTEKHMAEINATIDRFGEEKLIPEKTAKALKTTDPKTPRFYMLPKVHKPGVPGRPIISAIGSPTSKIAEYVDYHLQPLASELPSFIKDTGAFLRKINSLDNTPEGAILVTMDVSSLYTNIPHREGINAAAQALEGRATPSISTRVIIKFLSLVLFLNNFLFNDRHFLQKKGCAMGAKCSGSYADIFMGKFERERIYPKINYKHQCYVRFKDDIFLIWTAGEEALKQFIQEINQCHDSIKFEVKYSRTKINFLDVLIHLSKEGIITTILYKKPTNRNGYLHHSSYHPIEQIRNIPFGQYLRAKKICSNSNEAKKSMHEIASKLNNRG